MSPSEVWLGKYVLPSWFRLLIEVASLWLYDWGPWVFLGCWVEATHLSQRWPRNLSGALHNTAVCFLKAGERVSFSSLLRENLTLHEVIRGWLPITFVIFCLEAIYSFYLTLKGKRLKKGVTLRYVYLKNLGSEQLWKKFRSKWFSVFLSSANRAARCRLFSSWHRDVNSKNENGILCWNFRSDIRLYGFEPQICHKWTVQLYFSMPQFLLCKMKTLVSLSRRHHLK